jgi:ribosomal protein S18 acetylase RimI-like enzyme
MIAYRDATPADAAALHELFDTVFCETFGRLYRREDLEAFRSKFVVADWERQLADPAFAVRIADVDGAPAGYIKIGPVKLPVDRKTASMLVDQLYVRAEHHGTGIARELMDRGIDEARRRRAEALYLTVFIDNHRARRFYERYGFEDVGRYAFMVGEQADEDIIMRKAL